MVRGCAATPLPLPLPATPLPGACGGAVATKPSGRKPSLLAWSRSARCSASGLAPTIRVSKVSLPSTQLWRISRCHSLRTMPVKTRASSQAVPIHRRE